MTENKRFSWEYSHYDSTGEIYDWKRKECLITDYLQKYEIEEWCQELNKIVDENEQLRFDFNEMKGLLHSLEDEIENLEKENKELKIKNDLLSDELEQAKAVINKKWNEYLKKKELSE